MPRSGFLFMRYIMMSEWLFQLAARNGLLGDEEDHLLLLLIDEGGGVGQVDGFPWR